MLCKIDKAFLERYRSGHNGAVLKTVRGQLHVGSNPTLSAIYLNPSRSFIGAAFLLFIYRVRKRISNFISMYLIYVGQPTILCHNK